MARRYNHRRAKIHRSYSIAEIEKLFDVHKNTVQRWISCGLIPIERKRPFLIHGSELRRFLSASNPRKQPCRAGEIYCVKCRVPRRPACDMVDYVAHSPTGGAIKGICPTCETIIYRAVKRADLDTTCATLSVSHSRAQQRISDSSNPSLNGDSKKEPE